MGPREIRAGRKRLGLSQAALGQLVGVSQVMISNWERGKAPLGSEDAASLRKLFSNSSNQVAPEVPAANFGDWVMQQRNAKGLSRNRLADKVGISPIQVYNIETGRTANPRQQTRDALQKLLGNAPKPLVEAVQKAAEIRGVGQLTDFNPHDEDDFPSEPGVYVFYDIGNRATYVGQSSNIKRRVRGHMDKFFYREPIVETAVYVRVEDTMLRRQLEEALIRFLNPSLNKKGVDRSNS